MNATLVSVIMPVYNAEKYIAESIESILHQSYSNFEFLIFDDGSTDNSKEIISRYAARDKRIIAFYSSINLGYVVHLNKGILEARGELIARMDSDDISLPDRILCQVEFLKTNPDVSLVGSSTIRIDENGSELGVDRRHVLPDVLLWQSFFTNPLAHPTVMFRKTVAIAAGLYNPVKLPAEDFELWTRILREYRVSNLNIPLLKYREHSHSISQLKGDFQRENSMQALKEHWLFFCKVHLSNEVAEFYRGYHKGVELKSSVSIRPAYYSIMRLYIMSVRRAGFVKYVEEDAFGKLYYLVSRSFKCSFRLFLELIFSLALLFPLRTFRKAIRV